jgi:Fe-S-cluster containining protein
MESVQVEPDPARLDALERSGSLGRLEQLITSAKRVALGNATVEDKADELVSIAESISKTLSPHLACSKGCNHCCYMAVAVSDYEADMIGRYLGRDKVAAGMTVDKFAEAQTIERYTAVKCSLLGADGRCSVYPVRPMACRTHHNLAKNEDNCRITGIDRQGPLPTTPAINLNGFVGASALVLFRRQYADVREWFPAPKDTI